MTDTVCKVCDFGFVRVEEKQKKIGRGQQQQQQQQQQNNNNNYY